MPVILPDIFMREFRKDMNAEIIINRYFHEYKSFDIKNHPYSKLAVAIPENFTKIDSKKSWKMRKYQAQCMGLLNEIPLL